MPEPTLLNDITHKKTKSKTFPIFKIQTRSLTVSFKDLSSCLAQSPNELWSYKMMVEKWLMWILMINPPNFKGV